MYASERRSYTGVKYMTPIDSILNGYSPLLMIPEFRLKIKYRSNGKDTLMCFFECKPKRTRYAFYMSKSDTSFISNCSSGFVNIFFFENNEFKDSILTTEQKYLSGKRIHPCGGNFFLSKNKLERFSRELLTIMLNKNASQYFTVERFPYSIWFSEDEKLWVIYLEGQKWKLATLEEFFIMNRPEIG